MDNQTPSTEVKEQNCNHEWLTLFVGIFIAAVVLTFVFFAGTWYAISHLLF